MKAFLLHPGRDFDLGRAPPSNEGDLLRDLELELKSVRKDFGPVSVINGVDLDIKNGEFAVLVGPSRRQERRRTSQANIHSNRIVLTRTKSH